jgi:capsule polysaccharide export protein KpsC/LpsZ
MWGVNRHTIMIKRVLERFNMIYATDLRSRQVESRCAALQECVFRSLLKNNASRFNVPAGEWLSRLGPGDLVLYNHADSPSQQFLKYLCQGAEVRVPKENEDYARARLLIYHSLATPEVLTKWLELAQDYGKPLIVCEDGFLRSYSTWADESLPPELISGLSYNFSYDGPYYFVPHETELLRLLNSDAEVSPGERDEAQKLIQLINQHKLSKYNHQAYGPFVVGDPSRPKVVVIDQSYGDYSICYGGASEQSFRRMLETAVRENPDADVVVKTHPDTKVGARKGYFDNVETAGNVIRCEDAVNPHALFEMARSVYVVTSGMGFEALLQGKDVRVFGMPFYAGWGLTKDYVVPPLRRRTRTLEEIFHLFYNDFTCYVDPYKKSRGTLRGTIENLKLMVEDHRPSKADDAS